MAKNFFHLTVGGDNHDIILPLSRRTAPSPFHSHGALRMGNEGGRQAGRQQHATSLSSLSSVAQSINVRASLPASERPNANAVLVCLIGPRSLLCRCAAPPSPRRHLRPACSSTCLASFEVEEEEEKGRRGRQADRRLSDLEILPLSSLQASRPSVVRSVRRPTTVAHSLARSVGADG